MRVSYMLSRKVIIQKDTSMSHDSRHQYLALLRQRYSIIAFRGQLASILTNDPFFFPVHLEVFWLAEELGDTVLVSEILDDALSSIKKLLKSRKLQIQATNTWTTLEIDALGELMEIMKKRRRKRVSDLFFLHMASMALFTLIHPKTKLSTRESRYLKLLKTIDVKPLQKEIKNVPAAWWLVHPDRTEEISHHQHTHAIFLRRKMEESIPYKPVDGVHESVKTKIVELLPRLHKEIIVFAEEQNIALGRVAIVRVQPWAQVYRHFDSEEEYKTRHRYHLVLQAGGNNVLTSGDESVDAKPGEMWFFANKIYHRAHNKSSEPRIHVIFDGYPLSPSEAT